MSDNEKQGNQNDVTAASEDDILKKYLNEHGFDAETQSPAADASTTESMAANPYDYSDAAVVEEPYSTNPMSAQPTVQDPMAAEPVMPAFDSAPIGVAPVIPAEKPIYTAPPTLETVPGYNPETIVDAVQEQPKVVTEADATDYDDEYEANEPQGYQYYSKDKDASAEYQMPGEMADVAEDEAAAKITADLVDDMNDSISQGSADTETENQYEEEKPSFFSNTRNRILLTVGVAVLVLVVFQVVKHVNTNRQSQITEMSDKNQAILHQQQAAAAKAARAAEMQQQAVSASSDVQTLQHQTASNNASVTQLQNEVQNLQASMDRMNNTNTELAASMLSMHKQMTSEIKKLTAPKVKKTAAKKAVYIPITYTVKAIMSGRAWLRGSNDQSYSVAVGNTIKDAGTVTKIDADNGRVQMSNGKVLQLGQNDQ